MKIWLKRTIKWLNHEDNNPLITINISSSSLLWNLDQFSKIKPDNKIFPVLKSNAYGHGLIEIASILKAKSDCFVIDSYFEAQHLRNEGIETPLLVIGYVRPENINKSKLKNISYTIGSLDALYSIKSPTKIHLKIDTGMHRQGILPEEVNTAFDFIKKNNYIEIEGICSHLNDADNIDKSFTTNQIEIWNNIVDKAKKEFPLIKYIHLSNTSGHNFSKEITANVSRLGIGLYGLADISGFDLKPVLELKTIITGIKKIKKGETVGYNNTFIASEDMTMATIPVGYYECLDRRLSNKGFVRIGNTYCPIIGRVSMNITTIDISKLENLKIGDEVQVISPVKQDKNSIKSIAEICGTITYEIAVKIQGGIKRKVI